MKYVVALVISLLSCTLEIKAQSIDNKITQMKIALLIGNSEYQYLEKLKNPVNDVLLMNNTLKNIGFETLMLLNATQKQLEDTLYYMYNNWKSSCTFLLYYAGHGVTLGNEQYLVPIDVSITDPLDIKMNCQSIQNIVNQLKYKNMGANVIVVDACRKNWTPRTWQNTSTIHINPPKIPSGTIIAYSTDNDEFASDSPDAENSIYTGYLAKEIKKTLEIRQVFDNVNYMVSQQTNHIQNPIYWSQLSGVLYLNQTTTNEKKIQYKNINIAVVGVPLENQGNDTIWIMKNEVTQELWQEIMQYNPSTHQNCKNCPVETVSLNTINEFVKKLNIKTKSKWSIPSYEQWYYVSNIADEFDSDKMWTMHNSNNKTHTIGTSQPNRYGIYDMIGNVWEMTLSTGGTIRLCGGSYLDTINDDELSKNRQINYENFGKNIGFRLLLNKF